MRMGPWTASLNEVRLSAGIQYSTCSEDPFIAARSVVSALAYRRPVQESLWRSNEGCQILKRGVVSSLAGESRGVETSKRARRRKLDTGLSVAKDRSWA
jgi:hypothetical protein